MAFSSISGIVDNASQGNNKEIRGESAVVMLEEMNEVDLDLLESKKKMIWKIVVS